MLSEPPLYVGLVFTLTTLLTIWFFYRASKQSKTTDLVLAVWMIGQAVLAIGGFYQKTGTIPPRFPLLIAPPLLLILVLFLTRWGRRFVDTLRLDWLTLLHVVRIPVEIVLFWLFVAKAVPQEMTFEGRNFDILSGLSAPVVYYFGFVKKRLSRPVLLVWNGLCLGLLLNVVATAVLAAPSPFQQIGFNQPNIAIQYFPFVWLPSVVVPLVLLAHLVAFWQLKA